MADALISFVVESLCSMALQKLRSLVGVNQEDLGKLWRDFDSLQAVLTDAEKRQVNDESVKRWLGDLKDVAYDIEDVLEEWKVVNDGCDDSTSSVFKKVFAYSFSLSSFISRPRFHVETRDRIKAISVRLDEIKERKNSFSFSEVREGGVSKLDMRETCSSMAENKIFGREGAKELIVNRLVVGSSDEEQGVRVISIIGVAGIGKTVVAQLVYKDGKVQGHFDEMIWVSCPGDFDVMRIHSEIINGLGWKLSYLEYQTPSASKKRKRSRLSYSEYRTPCASSMQYGSSSLEYLTSTVSEMLEDRRILLVLDGVRNIDDAQWERLMIPFSRAKKESRILVTTRNENVTKFFSSAPYELQPLFENDCWSLFSHRAFSRGRSGDERVKLEALGREIVNKCQGIPLLLDAIGSALRNKRDVQDWQSVLDEATGDSLGNDKIASVVLESFLDLPKHLKQCFAFCSIFPKEHLIEKDMLIKLWMAQGFIPQTRRKDMERLGGSYFDDLVRRSLFQVIETDEEGDPKYCMIYDMIHDLCKSIMTECLIIKEETPRSQLAKARHASWICNEDVKSIPSFIYEAENLRTLILIGWSEIPSLSQRFFDSLKRLRALDLSVSTIERLTNSLQNLKLLQYLDLSTTRIEELPEFVSGLCLLQTLKLNHCHRLRKLPKGIVKLSKLRHLEFEGTSLVCLPEGMGGLTSLRTLTEFVTGGVWRDRGCKIAELKDLNLLQGKLEITCLNRVASTDEANEAKLNNKQNIQTLKLSGQSVTSYGNGGENEVAMKQVEGVFEALRPPPNLRDLTVSEYIGRQFPRWMEDCSLYSSLTKMQLSNCGCRQMPALGKLPFLKWLKIEAILEVTKVGSEFFGNSHETFPRNSHETFPKLEILIFERMHFWEEWELKVGAESFPSLFQLCLSDCTRLKALPELQDVISLQELKIHHCPFLYDRCWKEGAADWNKIAHVPNITINE